jgi:hypothetical protein
MIFSSNKFKISVNVFAGIFALVFILQRTMILVPTTAHAEEASSSADVQSSSVQQDSSSHSQNNDTKDNKGNNGGDNQDQGGHNGNGDNNGNNDGGDNNNHGGHNGDGNGDNGHGHDHGHGHGDGNDNGDGGGDNPVDPCTTSQISVISGTSDKIGGSLAPAVPVQTPLNSAWTAAIPTGAIWIWSASTVAHPTQDETFTFIKKFSVSGTASATQLVLAADNTYSVSLNGHLIGSSNAERNFITDTTYTVDPSFFYNGMNTLVFTIKNLALANATSAQNPAGVVYALTGSSRACPTDTAGPANTAPTVTLIGANPLVFTLGSTFIDPGATGNDAEDGSITPVVTGGNGSTTNLVTTTILGTTTLTYTVTDTLGASANVTRTVVIIPALNGGGNDNPGGGDTGTTTATSTATTTATTTPSGGNDTPNPTITSTTGGSSGSFSGFVSGGGSGSSLPSSCPLITTFMKIGDNNDRNDVLRLQGFLLNTEHFDVDVNGIFDQKTDAAVKAFQAKYLNETMGPWHVTTPTGYVYIATKKKINEIACNSSLIFTSDEQAIIDAYLHQGQGNQVGTNNGATGTSTPDNSAPTGSTTPIIGQTGGTNTDLTGAAVNSSVFSRFWNFLKNIF